MARPTKYTETARAKILDALRAGMTRQAAAGTAGIHVTQVTRWCAIYASFATDCAVAEQQAEARFTLVVTKAAQEGDAKIALEWLKRRRRDEWGDSLNLTKTNDDDLLREAAAIVERTRAGSAGGSDSSEVDA